MHAILCGGGIYPKDLFEILSNYNLFGNIGIDARTTIDKEYIESWIKYFSKKKGFDVIKTSKTSDLEELDVYFVLGGDQSRYLREVRNTKFHEELKERIINGGIKAFGGTSAGAMVWGKISIAYTEEILKKIRKEFGEMRVITVEEPKTICGLSILEESFSLEELLKKPVAVVIDTHFKERWRMQRLYDAVIQNSAIGIGINESSIIILSSYKKGLYLRVIGSAFIILPRRIGEEYSEVKVFEIKDTRIDFLKILGDFLY